jgi:hypothetical protein
MKAHHQFQWRASAVATSPTSQPRRVFLRMGFLLEQEENGERLSVYSDLPGIGEYTREEILELLKTLFGPKVACEFFEFEEVPA